MKKTLTIAGIIGIIAIILFFAIKISSITYIEDHDRDVDSFGDIPIALTIFSGILLIITAFLTYHLHILLGIIPFGIGISTLLMGIYLAWCKYCI